MNNQAAAQAAQTLWNAWIENRTIDQLPPDCRPQTIADGYVVQAALGSIAGTRVGWKVAGTTEAAREMLGVEEPLYGPLYERFAVAPAGAAECHGLAGVAEGEFALTISRTLSPADAPYTRTDILDAVASVHPAIELPGSRFKDFGSVGVAHLVADCAGAGIFVIGAPGEVALADLPDIQVQLSRNDIEVAVGSGANVLGDPLEVLVWLVNQLAERGIGVDKGEVILTGAAALSRTILAGDQLIASFDQLGVVSVNLR